MLLTPVLLRRRRSGGDPFAAYVAGGVSPAFVLDPVAGFYAASGVKADGLSDIATFARASAQRYRGSSGLLASVTSGNPALAHHVWGGSSYVNAGLLMEPAIASNRVTSPENFADGYWTKSFTGTLSVNATGPDGTTSATTLIADSGGGQSAVYVGANPSGFATSTLHTWSFFARAGSLPWVFTFLEGFTTPGPDGPYFNLSTGAFGGSYGAMTGIAKYVERYADGWYRIMLVFTSDPADTAGRCRIQLSDGNGDFNVPRDGASSVKVFGGQFHAGPPSGYIGTTARAATTLTMAAADLPYSGAGMSGKLDGTFTVGAQTLFDWRADANNRITLAVDASGNFTLTMVNGGSSASVTTTDGVPLGIHEEGTVAWYVSGASIGISLDGATADEQATAIGIPDLSSADATAGGNGTIAELTLWDSNLAASGIEEASAAGFFI